MSRIIFYDELSAEAQKYAVCLQTMEKAIAEKTPILAKKTTRGSVKKFLSIIPELKMVVDAITSENYFPMGCVSYSPEIQSEQNNDEVLEFSFNSEYSVEGQNLWWSPTSPKHTVMFDEIDEPITILQNVDDIKN